MEKQTVFNHISGALLPWYEKNKRDLPWRADRDPYHIWISEIMLQQTRVEAVKAYYERFLSSLPSIADLAKVDDDLLQKLWEGLGYYSRVRNLKKAAQEIISVYGGVFPREYSQVLSLPGIGEYTAGAICSIAFNQPTPAVDGNVLRVISRITDDATSIDLPAFKKLVRQKLAEIYPSQAGEFTQALMELGATICGPNRKPLCQSCPCATFCKGYLNGTAESLPVKSPKKQRKVEHKTVFVLSCGELYALQKREDHGLLAGLWQFPNIPGTLDTDEAIKALEDMGLRVTELCMQIDRKHVFTHIEWLMRGLYVEVAEPTNDFNWLTIAQIKADAALPTAFRQFMEEIENA